MRVRTVVVGVDPSPNARVAFDWARTFAVAFGAELVVVHAVGLLEHAGVEGSPSSMTWWDELDAPGVELRRVVRDGNPVSLLQAVRDEEHADLVVVGARGKGDAPSRQLGSTSSQLLLSGSVPVVVVPIAAS
jgi:nucleotide-binding universal stress UspA family protein